MDKILLLEQQEVRPRASIPKDEMGVASLENKAPGKGTPEGSVGWGPTHYISFLAEAQCDGVPDKGPQSGLGWQQPRSRSARALRRHRHFHPQALLLCLQ